MRSSGLMDRVTYPEMPLEEHELRQSKLKELMKKHKLDGLVLFSPINLRYYLGYRKPSYGASEWWRRAAIFTADGTVVLVLPQIHWVVISKTTWVEDIRPWGGAEYLQFPKNFMDPFVDAIRELKLDRARIGFELDSHTQPDLSFREFEEIRSRLPHAEIVDGSPVYWEQRQIKTDFELKIIRKLCEITVKGVDAGFSYAREGISENQVYNKMWEVWIREGINDCPMAGRMMLRSGIERYSFLNAPPTDRKLKQGDGLYCDGGPCYKGYFSDVQRVVNIGEPSALQVKLHAAALEALDAMISVVRDGVKVSDVFNAGVGTLKRIAPEAKHTISLAGHGFGLQTHEPPYIVANSESRLRAGMTLALELQAADFPEYRVVGGFPEDNGIVTQNGFENLTKHLKRDLWVVSP